MSRRCPVFMTLLASVSLWSHKGGQKAMSVGKWHQGANTESLKMKTKPEAKVLDSQAVTG